MATSTMRETSDRTSLREQFWRDGLIKVEGMLDPSLLAECRRCFDWSRANPGPMAKYTFEGTRHQHWVDNSNLDAVEIYRELVRAPAFGEVLSDLLESRHVWYFSEEIFERKGGISGRTPWHQDTAYQPWGGRQWANIWISFQDLPKQNALEVVKGSHLGPLYDGSSFANPDKPAEPLHGGSWTPLPDIEAERTTNPGARDFVSYPTKPGDAIILHPHAIHGGAPVDDDCPDRSTLVLRFFGDDGVFRPFSPETTFTFFGRVPETYEAAYGGLKAGDPLRSRIYEQIR